MFLLCWFFLKWFSEMVHRLDWVEKTKYTHRKMWQTSIWFCRWIIDYNEYDVFCLDEKCFRLVGKRLLHTIHSLRFQHIVLIFQHRLSSILENPEIVSNKMKSLLNICQYKSMFCFQNEVEINVVKFVIFFFDNNRSILKILEIIEICVTIRTFWSWASSRWQMLWRWMFVSSNCFQGRCWTTWRILMKTHLMMELDQKSHPSMTRP